MKKVFLISLFLVSWYLAGFFHAAHIMVLAAAETMLFLAMYLLSWYLRSRVQLSAESLQNLRLHTEKDALCSVTVENTGVLPVTKVQLKWNLGYRRNQTASKKMKRDKNCRRRKESRSISLDAKEALLLKLLARAELCGLLDVTIKKAYLWDYLGLFRRRFAQKTSIEIAVLPPKHVLRICLEGSSAAEEETERELFQIREYQQGDRARDIAWKQSVRSDNLFVKEYREISDACSELFLDLAGCDEYEPEKISAFYQVLYGVVAGLLAVGRSLRVCWRCEDNTLQSARISSEREIDLLLCRLYREEDRFNGLTAGDEAACAKGFCLDLELNLFYGKKRVAIFEAEKLSEQLAQTVYIGEGFDEK